MRLLVCFVLLMLLQSLAAAVTVVDHHPDDEYVLEHEVTRDKALDEARKLKLYPGNFGAQALICFSWLGE